MKTMASVCRWFLILVAYACTSISSSSISDSSFLTRLQSSFSNHSSFDNFYNNLLKKVRNYRPIDTVRSPINLSRIQNNNYDEKYLHNSCYRTGFDLLRAHGYSDVNAPLTIDDIQSLLPALLYSIENPGCQRQPPSRQRGTFLDVWLFGIILLLSTKLVHLLSVLIAENRCSTSITTDENSDPTGVSDIRFISTKSRLWVCLGFNAFTCGLILGTIIYHLIPQIYEIPNEDFHYVYLFRATIVFCGVYLFFIVEKLLRLRFKVDEAPFDETESDANETGISTDPDMLRMAKMHGTLHVGGGDDMHHKHLADTPSIPLRTAVNVDSGDDDADENSNKQPLTESNKSHHHSTKDLKTRTRNLIFYHLINDISLDLIFGCGLATALAQNRLIALILWFVIFTEGFRRHLEMSSSLDQKRSTYLVIASIIFILFGYLLGGSLADVNKPIEQYLTVIRAEYIYSIVYGAFFYLALVTLIPGLNELGQNLQMIAQSTKQTTKQRRWKKTCVLLVQNLFLLLGVLLSLLIAFVWRQYHRLHILNFVCTHDSLHSLCSQNYSH